MRTKVLQVVISLAFFVVVFLLGYMQLIRGGYYRNLSKRNSIRLIAKEAPRGKILDRDDRVIADNELSFDVAVIPAEIEDKDEIFLKLSQLAGSSIESIKARYKKNYASPFVPVVVLKNVSKDTAILVEEGKDSLGGVLVNLKPQRHYPYNNLASHVLGYLGQINSFRFSQWKDYGYGSRDLVGYLGVEENLDNFLKPKDGGLQVQVDHHSRIIRVLGVKMPKEGKDVSLTIDLRIQKISEEALSGKKGAVVILNPNTGEVISMVSFPNFDPELSLGKDKQSSLDFQELLKDRDSPLVNRAISGAYPPGSIFKPVVVAAALESKKISPSTTYLCEGSTYIGKRQFSCWSKHGIQNLFDAIKHSCDIYFYRTGILLGPDLISDYARMFGLGKATGIDIPYEKKGFVPTRLWKKLSRNQDWYDGDTANFSIGQGDLLVTPIQMARLMAVFANGGYLVTPYLVKSVDKKVFVRANGTKLPISQQTIDTVRRGLLGAVQDETGTAHILSLENLKIAGKTGTAQAANAVSHGWFLGFCPFEKPKLVICVFLENGASSHNACMVAREILEKIVQNKIL